MASLAVVFAFTACDEQPDEPKDDGQIENPDGPGNSGDPENPENPGTSDIPKFDFPFVEAYPIEAGNLIAEGSDVGVTIEVTKVEDQNFVFELRPGPMVQSFKFDVYPLAQLYYNLLNSHNSGNLETDNPVKINERIRDFLFTEGSGGFAISINDYENTEDFLQIEYDWMNTPYAAASAIAIPDCDFIVAVVASTEPDISSANQEELTLCFLHTTSQPLVGDPQCEIEVVTGYTAFGVQHHPNSDAAGVYYFGGLTEEIDNYIDTFGDTMYRDFMRTLYTAPVSSDNADGLSYSKDYGLEPDPSVKSTTTAVAVDVNMTPQEGYARQDFSLKERPEDIEFDEPSVEIITDRVAAAYFEFYVNMPKDIATSFWNLYTPEDKASIDAMTPAERKKKVVAALVNQGGYGGHNPNFAWNEDAPDGEKATGKSGRLLCDLGGSPGATYYVGFVGRNGYMNYTDIIWSEPVTLDQRNYTSPDNCKVKDLKIWCDNVTRTSFRLNLTYDPATVSMVYVQYMTQDNKPEGLTPESSWEDWVKFILPPGGATDGFGGSIAFNPNMNAWPTVASGSDPLTWTGMKPGVEYTIFCCAEDFEGNISPMQFTTVTTKEVQVGPDPWVNMSLENTADGLSVVYTMDHDVEKFKYCLTDDVADLKIPGANNGHLGNIAESGIAYETWRDAIYEWVAELGMDTDYESVSQDVSAGKTQIAACLAIGKDENGEPVYKMNHLIIKNGKAQTLEEIFGIK